MRPQQNLWSFDLMLICLVALAATFFLLTLYSILQTNLDVFNINPVRWLSVKILDTSSSATLFVTVFGALLVRHQFALGILPRMNYTSGITSKADTRNPGSSFETWRVEIRNTGLGSAIINNTAYAFEASNVKEGSGFKTFREINSDLAKLGLNLGSDYWMGNITSGFSMSPKDEFLVFEIKTEHKDKVKRLNMVLYFQGQLGDKYRREIFLIPQP